MKNLATIFKKKKQMLGDICAAATGIAAMGLTRATVWCGVDGLFDKKIDVDVSNLSADNVIGRGLGIIGGISVIVGIFYFSSGFLQWVQARGDSNAAGESKHANSIGTGLVLIAAPTLLAFLFK